MLVAVLVALCVLFSSCQGASVALWQYTTYNGFFTLNALSSPGKTSHIASCAKADLLSSWVAYGGTGDMGKGGSIYRYVVADSNTVAVRECNCYGDCCYSEKPFSAFPDASKHVTSLSYAFVYQPRSETVYFTIAGDSVLYGISLGDTSPKKIFDGKLYQLTEIKNVWCPLYGNCSFLAQQSDGGLALGYFYGNSVMAICFSVPSDFEGATLFRQEYSYPGTTYGWVKPDSSIWGAWVEVQSSCEIYPFQIVDSSYSKGPVDLDLQIIGSSRDNGKREIAQYPFVISYTDSEGYKWSNSTGQPALLYSTSGGGLVPLYFSGNLITMCDPSPTSENMDQLFVDQSGTEEDNDSGMFN